MTHGSLFSGIGGFDLAAEWMGWENVFHCEWNDFGKKVLNYYWPNSISYHDITKTDFTIHRGRIDILTGGFPCQPYSLAGKRLGKEDERHLWPEMLRAIKEIQPRWVVGENVYGLVNWSEGLVFHEVQTDLEAQGYEVFPYVLPACSVNAPHRRDRIWFVAKNTMLGRCIHGGNEQKRAEVWEQWNTCTRDTNGVCLSTGDATHPNTTRCENWDEQYRGEQTQNGERQCCTCGYCIGIEQDVANPNGKRGKKCNIPGKSNKSEQFDRKYNECDAADTDGIGFTRKEHGKKERRWTTKTSVSNDWSNFPTQSPICSRNDGLSSRLDGITFSKWRNESIKAAGNAIVPQVVFQIFKAIQEYENTQTPTIQAEV